MQRVSVGDIAEPLAGNEIETHHWEMLEDYLVELLANKYGLDTLDVSWHFCQMRPTAPSVTPFVRSFGRTTAANSLSGIASA